MTAPVAVRRARALRRWLLEADPEQRARYERLARHLDAEGFDLVCVVAHWGRYPVETSLWAIHARKGTKPPIRIEGLLLRDVAQLLAAGLS